MKKNLLIFALLVLGFSGTAYALPYFSSTQTLVPFNDNSWDIGTSTATYRNAYITQICLSGDCKTAWPSGSGSSVQDPFPTHLGGGNATSSIVGFTGGFFSSASSTISTLHLGNTLDAPNVVATAANASSTFVGGIEIGTSAAGIDLYAAPLGIISIASSSPYAPLSVNGKIAGTVLSIDSTVATSKFAGPLVVNILNGLVGGNSGLLYQISTSSPVSMDISGNAGTVTNGVYTTGAGSVYEVPLTFNYPLSRSVNAVSLNGMATGTISNGTGISVTAGQYVIGSGLTITNTAPDQTVVLNAGTGISTSGTYPNFTVTNTAPQTFSYPFPGNATSTSINFSGGIQVGTLSGLGGWNNGTPYGVSTSSPVSMSITGNAATASALSPGANINGVAFTGAGNITIQAASSTLLADGSTWSGSNNFTTLPKLGTLNGLISGNAGNLYQSASSTLYGTGTAGQVLMWSGSNPTWTSTTSLSSVFADAPLGGNGTAGSHLTCTGCLTANQSITLSGVVTGTGSTAITTAFGSQTAGVLGNAVTGNTAPMATSTLFGVSTGGKVLGWDNNLNGIGWVATSTSGSSLTGSTGQVAYFSGTDTAVGTSTITVNTDKSVVINSQLQVPRIGIGLSPSPQYLLDFSGSASGAEPTGLNFYQTGSASLSPDAGTNAEAVYLRPKFTEASSGNHTIFSSIYLDTPIFTAGAATVSNTANLYVAGAMSETVSGANYAIWSAAGVNRFDGGILSTASSTFTGVFSLGTTTAGCLNTSATGVVYAATCSSGLSSVTADYPLTGLGTSGSHLALAFGTTTSNTWANTQTFTNPIVNGTLSGLIAGNAGITYAISTSSPVSMSITGNAATVTTNANLSGVVTSSGNTTSFGTQNAGVLGAVVNGATTAPLATSTLFGVANYGDMLIYNSGLKYAATSSLNIAISDTKGTLSVARGGTGAITLTGCLTGNGTGAITGSGTCNTSNATVSSIATNNGLTGGTITTTGTIGLATINAGVLGAVVNGAVPTSQATSTLYGVGNYGDILMYNSGIKLTATSSLFTMTGTGLMVLSNAPTFSGIATFATASSTALYVSTLGNSAGSLLAIDGNGQLIATTTSVSAGLSVAKNTISQVENSSFSYATTSWVGTTTIPLGVGYGETWNNVKCFTDAGTLGIDFYHASTHFNFIRSASTTIGINSMGSAVDTTGDTLKVDIGNPATSPTKVSCTVNDTI